MTSPESPPRRSIADRLTQPRNTSGSGYPSEDGRTITASLPVIPDAGGSSILTSTGAFTTTDIGTYANQIGDENFRVDADGAVTSERDVTFAPQSVDVDAAEELDHYTAIGHHLLCFNDLVSVDEVEALAISLYDTAKWIGPGMLRLKGQARLEGPFILPVALRQEFSIPADKSHVWLLVCPPERGHEPTLDEMRLDPWGLAFPEGLPIGLEREMLDGIERLARRLAGSIRIAGSGWVTSPDPDSAVSLSVYAPRWLEPGQLIAAMRHRFPDVIDARDLEEENSQPRRRKALDIERLRQLEKHAVALDPELKERLEAERVQAMMGTAVLDGYALLFRVGNRSRVQLEVRPTDEIPQALRWEQWASKAVVHYFLRWLPYGELDELPPTGMSRTVRLERARATRDIEDAAAVLSVNVGGKVIDEDGFIVAFADPSGL